MKRASIALIAVAGLVIGLAGCKCPPVKDPGAKPAPVVKAQPKPAPKAAPAPKRVVREERVVVREPERRRPAPRPMVVPREPEYKCGWWAACYRHEDVRDMGRLRDDWPSGPCCEVHANCR